jgi:DNA-binding transcriptional regulator YhcF (GntR family)
MADDAEKRLDEIIDRRIDTKMREVIEALIAELRQRGIIEEGIQAFLARRRKNQRKSDA